MIITGGGATPGPGLNIGAVMAAAGRTLLGVAAGSVASGETPVVGVVTVVASPVGRSSAGGGYAAPPAAAARGKDNGRDNESGSALASTPRLALASGGGEAATTTGGVTAATAAAGVGAPAGAAAGALAVATTAVGLFSASFFTLRLSVTLPLGVAATALVSGVAANSGVAAKVTGAGTVVLNGAAAGVPNALDTALTAGVVVAPGNGSTSGRAETTVRAALRTPVTGGRLVTAALAGGGDGFEGSAQLKACTPPAGVYTGVVTAEAGPVATWCRSRASSARLGPNCVAAQALVQQSSVTMHAVDALLRRRAMAECVCGAV